jgi:siroheme decarboxylase
MTLDDIDRRLFRLAQSDFPISLHPYRDLGRICGITEADTLARLKKLKRSGYIRRIGPVWDAKSLGYASLLVAFKIKPSQVEKAAVIISRCRGVTHNYLRQVRYNIWFTLTAKDKTALQNQLSRLIRQASPEGVLELPATRIYKIGVKLEA